MTQAMAAAMDLDSRFDGMPRPTWKSVQSQWGKLMLIEQVRLLRVCALCCGMGRRVNTNYYAVLEQAISRCESAVAGHTGAESKQEWETFSAYFNAVKSTLLRRRGFLI